MRTVHTLLLAGSAGLLAVGCGDSSAGAPATTTGAAATTTAGAGVAHTTTTLPVATGSTMAGTTPTTVGEGPVQYDVRVGVDSGPHRVEKVKVGSDVTLNISNPKAADEFHVHVVDMEQKVTKGETATFNFTADTKGRIEVESHVTNTVVIVIEVV
jgi:hypothetical protein